MINLDELFQDLASTRLHFWTNDLRSALERRFEDYTHGELNEWLELQQELPEITPSKFDFNGSVSIGQVSDCSDVERSLLKKLLMPLHPWRKGPFNLFGLNIDTEWRSDWKWDRLKPHISPLENRLVLDVGCGNGYHCWRMHGAGARLVIGIDPSQKFLMQFQSIKHYAGQRPVHLLPVGVEYMPEDMGKQGFDTVFSMGVLYHRKSPIEHIQHLKRLLRPGGEIVLETLVVDGDKDTVFVPSGRYAQMRNVWFLPSALALEHWLTRCGFKNVRTVDLNRTSLDEQRATEWMTFHSLADYMDPNDPLKTVEGHPGPTRAIVVAEA
ncbi:tRNA 5-methoxyuridine(34)/uridine 5-oxyacetic acid(34) synthase CmoB [Pleionea litopenaei]|uniref:tRNA U34 carboxymethyltransferase n=1 Tax=Pleionea litopenaei TaxID=3070815 RepID=A0AA51RVE3_9GAMM|nr:tRNA 5-methoxyuridine(34)/uridine 5-oxyacetic acid(34) synthase CmoB [Pleionea sp. HL-JVS1]WMS88220.1 tRNA 5-methoxyuridine(34)/uridine 5-oxyacetic acid(34) synthase CmoB [Pleionea sp. HL-JVS1]